MRNTFFEVLYFWKYLNPIFILFLVWLIIEMAWKVISSQNIEGIAPLPLTSVFAVRSLAICDHFSSLNLQDFSLSLGSEIPWWYAMRCSGARIPPRCWSLSASFDFGTQVFSCRKVSWIVSLISSTFHYFLFLEFLWDFLERGGGGFAIPGVIFCLLECSPLLSFLKNLPLIFGLFLFSTLLLL